jgi:hypothetical protein
MLLFRFLGSLTTVGTCYWFMMILLFVVLSTFQSDNGANAFGNFALPKNVFASLKKKKETSIDIIEDQV